MLCEACGRDRDIEHLYQISWSANNGKAERRYKVCCNCNNSFLVVVTDSWAKEIAECVTVSDGDNKYPPLICDGEYKDAFDMHLKQASEVVQTWPVWKQELLGGKATQTKSEAKVEIYVGLAGNCSKVSGHILDQRDTTFLVRLEDGKFCVAHRHFGGKLYTFCPIDTEEEARSQFVRC